MEEYLKIFAERLGALMSEKDDVSGRELARSIGTGKTTISQYLNMERSPKIDQLLKIAQYFNVSVSYLIGETDKRKC